MLLWGPVVAYMAAIFYFSAQSSPPTPGGLPDTFAHAIEYFGLWVVVFRALAGGLGAQVTAVRAMATMGIAVAYAVSDEVHQLFVPGRVFDLGDWRADAGGAGVVVLAWGLLSRRRVRLQR